MKSLYQGIKTKILSAFFIDEGGKKVIKGKSVKIAASVLMFLVSCFQMFWPEDQSDLGKSFKPLIDEEKVEQLQPEVEQEASQVNILSKEEAERLEAGSRKASRQGQPLPRPAQLLFNAKQVLERSEAGGTLTPLPSGTNFIGKLVNGIDTREANQVVKVILPYGARHACGGFLPKNAVLLGNASSGEDSEKVFIRFNRVVYPDGKEFKIDAQALNSADYSPGLTGIHHSNAHMRMAGSIALTMVSAGADVLTQRSMVGEMNPYAMGMAQPDSTARNAILQGTSQVTKQEAQRQMQDSQNAPEYVTVMSDSDLIINLLSPFIGETM
jgi:hypothetical protein